MLYVYDTVESNGIEVGAGKVEGKGKRLLLIFE